MKNKNRCLNIIAILLIFVISVFSFGGCSERGLEKGFTVLGGEAPTTNCAYKSDTRRFDIDNVTLTFYYGAVFSYDIVYELEHGTMDFSEGFDIYFENDNGDKVLVKSIDDNFVSEKYRVTVKYDNNGNNKVYNFCYSEELTIPEGLFTSTSGRIDFYLYGRNMKDKNNEKTVFCSTSIYYGKISESKVVLSEETN